MISQSGTPQPVEELYPESPCPRQWTRAANVIFLLLTILGGNIIQQALAQLSGGPITPVAFSFGWITHSLNALLAAVGENRLLPVPDTPVIVVNTSSRYSRQNSSWILGRIIRDFNYWKHPNVLEAEQSFLQAAKAQLKDAPESGSRPARTPRVALCIAVYEANPNKKPAVPERDLVWYSGLLCTLLQLGIAAIPYGLSGDWSILMITASGTCLAFASGALPQWKAEKWACRTGTTKIAALTRGNGSKDCIVVIGGGVGLDLEDLAAGREVDVPRTRVWTGVLTALWVAMLITVSGLNRDTWSLLAVGVVGLVQNVIASAAPRNPCAFGIHLNFREVIVEDKVMKALKAVERKYPHVGSSLLDIYFPGGLRPDEEIYWKEVEERAKCG